MISRSSDELRGGATRLPGSSAVLLTRDDFREGVFVRDGGECVVCRADGEHRSAVDAHHILERRLFDAAAELGGYFLDNGASLCAEHHLLAEQTVLSCDRLRELCGISRIVLPEHLYEGEAYDKWGNILHPDGTRSTGELFLDPSVQAVLRDGGVLPRLRPYGKHPRVYHLPWSETVTSDDRVLPDTRHFAGREIVVTEKLDGEQTTIYGPVTVTGPDGEAITEAGYSHARSIASEGHWSRSRLRELAARIGWDIPAGWRICGENVYGRHTIAYDRLPDFFFVWAIYRDDGYCLSWDETITWPGLFDLPVVPVLYRGTWDESLVRACWTGASSYGERQEGYVVRLAGEFQIARHRWSVAKFVAGGFVPAQNVQAWRVRRPEYNRLGEVQ